MVEIRWDLMSSFEFYIMFICYYKCYSICLELELVNKFSETQWSPIRQKQNMSIHFSTGIVHRKPFSSGKADVIYSQVQVVSKVVW